MTDPNRPVQEDELHAYVDDRLEPARRAEVERHLRSNPGLQHRIDGWREQAEALRGALAFRLQEPVPSSLNLGRCLSNASPAAMAVVRQRWRVAAAMLLMLGLGAAGGWTVRGTQRMGEVTRLGMERRRPTRVWRRSGPSD